MKQVAVTVGYFSSEIAVSKHSARICILPTLQAVVEALKIQFNKFQTHSRRSIRGFHTYLVPANAGACFAICDLKSLKA